MKKIYVLILFCLAVNYSFGQMAYKGLGSSNSTFLLGNTSAIRTQCLYLPADLTNAQSGTITNLYYRYGSTSNTLDQTLSNLTIQFGQTNNTVFTNGNEFFTGLSTVFSATSFTILGGTTGDWFSIPLTNTFSYDQNQTLIIDIGFTASTQNSWGTYGTTNNGRKLYNDSLGTATGTTTSATWQDMGFDFVPLSIANAGTHTFKVFPNPSTNMVYVAAGNEMYNGSTIVLTDLTGSTIAKGTLNGLYQFDMSNLAQGAYIMLITTPTGERIAKHLTKI